MTGPQAAAAVLLLCAALTGAALAPWLPRTGFGVALAAHAGVLWLGLVSSVVTLPSLTATTAAALYVLVRRLLGPAGQSSGRPAGRSARTPVLAVVAAAVLTAALVLADEAVEVLRLMPQWALDPQAPRFGPAQALTAVLVRGVPGAVVVPALTVAGAWVVGRWLVDRDRLAAGAAREAVAAERTRIARDLHDVVAHHVSLATVRAESAPYTVPDLSDGARDAFGEIATTSRRALDDLRDVLGVLGRGDEAQADRTPQPTLADVPALVAAAREAGAAVRFDGLADAADTLDVPAGTALAAHAVVREALSNARRHAPGAEVTVTVRQDDGTLHVEVSNPLPPAAPASRSTAALSAGLGLVGLRERVLAVGGTFAAGPVDGTFTVVATLPLRRRGEASA